MEATEKSLELMRIQTELMDQIAGVQDSIKNAVMNRQWDDFEALVESMQDHSTRFEELDAERAKLFAHMIAEPLVSDTPAARPLEARLYAFASHLPETERRQFTDLYRGLRLRAMKLRAASDSLLLYLNEAKTTVDGFVNAAFPERKSKLYSRRGMQIATDMRCMVLNRVF
ncbi:MAG: hypothetical protein LBJ41_04135 [Treponema sp.]|jgi:hypothetical protein|nr:hypothetical protein [Treponema sp.]